MTIRNQEQMDNLDISSVQNVEEINILNVNYIPEGKFANLPYLQKLNIYNTNIIEAGAFMNCKNLETFHINNDIKEIHDFAFYNTNVGFIPELCEDIKFGSYNNIGKNIKLENISWSNINKLSELGKCEKYFNIGDTKSIFYNYQEIYNVQIIGFNHDNLADNSGKAGITFQFQELISTTHAMNTDGLNKGGWETSEMRKYLKNDVYNLLPFDLQTKIKEVSKISDVGNKNTTDKVTTIDKLFLLSLEEVGLTSSYLPYFVSGQGEKYEKFTDNASRVKSYLSGFAAIWWLRSAYTNSTDDFFYVYDSGSNGGNCAHNTRGVAPAFCI